MQREVYQHNQHQRLKASANYAEVFSKSKIIGEGKVENEQTESRLLQMQ